MSEIVFFNNDRVVTSSRNIARDFGKEHRNVIRDIKGVLKNEQTQDMFYKSSYIHPQNKQEYKEYLINRDGFTLLVMGFTGKSAMEFKLKYIAAFNQMEKQIKEQSKPSYMIDDPIKRAEQWIVEQQKVKELQEDVNKQSQIIGELKPKADYTNLILKNKSLMTITQIAKDYGMTGQEMNKLLHSLKVQFKQSDQWLLYRNHHGKGYTHSETIHFERKDGTPDVKLNTKWTQRGRLFLYELLKENGIVPIIEKELV